MGELSCDHSSMGLKAKSSYHICSRGTQSPSSGRILACVILKDLPDSASRLCAPWYIPTGLGTQQALSTCMLSEKRTNHIKFLDQMKSNSWDNRCLLKELTFSYSLHPSNTNAHPSGLINKEWAWCLALHQSTSALKQTCYWAQSGCVS